MLNNIEECELQLLKDSIEKQMTEMLMSKSTDVDKFKKLSALNVKLHNASGVYLNVPHEFSCETSGVV